MDNKECLEENKNLKKRLKESEKQIAQLNQIKLNYDILLAELDKKDSELQKLNQKIEDLHVIDELTSLGNRKKFEDIFHTEFSRAKRNYYDLNFLLIDVDFFNKYKELYGSTKTNEVFKVLGEVLNNYARRGNDFVFRYEDDKFTYITCFQNEHEFLKLAQSIKDAVYEKQIEHKDNDHGFLTISIGAVISRNKSLNKEDIFLQACENLEKSKKDGKNQVTMTVL